MDLTTTDKKILTFGFLATVLAALMLPGGW